MAIVKSTEKKIKNQQALRNCLHYITNDKKASNVSFSDGGEFFSPLKTAEFYKNIRIAHNKNEGILAHHYVQSFSPEDKITPEQAHKIGMDFAKKGFFSYQVLVVTHTDCDHIHNHFIVNSVSDNGLKWHDKTQTREHLQKISDEFCIKNNLSVIEKRTGYKALEPKPLDQETYHAKQNGASWKVHLCTLIDEAVTICKSQKEFVDFLNQEGFEVKYTDKNIVFTPKNGTKGIRLKTLAKQFGNQYRRPNIESKMGFWERPKEFVRIESTKKPVKSTYDGEFQRFEKYLFEQINKPEVIETEKSMSNFSLKEILESYGKNFKGEIDLLELVKLKELDFLFYAEKFRDTAVVVIKKYNTEKLKCQVNILTKADKILLKERNLNNKNYSEILATAERNNEKPCYRVVNEIQFNRLKNSNLKFAYFQKGENYNVVFNKKDEETFNYAIKAEGLQL